MDSTLVTALVLLFSPFILLAVHILVARAKIIRSNQIGTVVASLLALLPVLALVWRFSAASGIEKISCMVYAFTVYFCIAYAYFHLFNMSETARRIRILHEIYKAKTLSRDNILSLYEASDIVEVRLKRLSLTGQLEQSGGAFVVKGKLLYYAAVFVEAWRSLLGFEPIDRAKILK